MKIKDFLINKDPFPNTKCKVKTCLVCSSETAENPSIPCNTNNVGYRLICDTCESRGLKRIYEGESSRSARIRGGEHYNDLKKEKECGVLFKHKQNEHKNEEMEVKMKIVKKFKDPLSRQANEAVRITNGLKNELLNSKNEFNHPPIARVSVEGKKKKFKPKYGEKIELYPRRSPA